MSIPRCWPRRDLQILPCNYEKLRESFYVELNLMLCIEFNSLYFLQFSYINSIVVNYFGGNLHKFYSENKFQYYIMFMVNSKGSVPEHVRPSSSRINPELQVQTIFPSSSSLQSWEHPPWSLSSHFD